MAGPLVKVGTKVARVTLDVSRKLNWGKGLALEFMISDTTQLSNWRTLIVVKRGFDRVAQDEKTAGDGSEVILQVSDENGVLGPVLRQKDLHVRVDNQIYRVGQIPPVPPNAARVYILTCKSRTVRTNFDTTKK